MRESQIKQKEKNINRGQSLSITFSIYISKHFYNMSLSQNTEQALKY